MTVLVTGATGFLGQALVRQLVNDEKEVRVLVRPTSNRQPLADLSLTYSVGSLNEPESLAAAVADVDTIYHCAALSDIYGPWESFEAANVTGVRNLLEAAREHTTLQRFLHVSTTDV